MTSTEHANMSLDPTVRRTREAWLEDAIAQLRPMFDAAGAPLPERLHVSVGFGYGAKRESGKLLGQCWATDASEDKVNHIFLTPEEGDPVKMLKYLVHELIHAADDCVSDHTRGSWFAKTAAALGIAATNIDCDEALNMRLELLAIELGHFPHGALTVRVVAPVVPAAGGAPVVLLPRSSGPKPQRGRQLKCQCPTCGFTMRTTQMWIAKGLPTCGCGTLIEQVQW